MLHVAAWFLFPPERAQFAADPSLLANLYISSAVTTFCIIALIVGYAFTVADTARAEADALLTNILPEPIAERLKERPDAKVADSVDEASVMFSDLVGFTELAHKLGAASRSRCSTRSSPNSIVWPLVMESRRSRRLATAIWRSPA